MASRRKTGLIVGLVVVGLAAAVGLGWGLFVGWSEDATPEDRRRGIDIGHVVALYGIEGEPGQSEMVRTRFLDGSYDVTLDYESEALLVSSFYSVERRSSDALGVYGGMLLQGPVMQAYDGIEVRDQPELFDWGDNATSKVVLADGEPIGHLVVARKGKVAFSVTVVGLVVQDAAEMLEFLDPILDSVKRDQ